MPITTGIIVKPFYSKDQYAFTICVNEEVIAVLGAIPANDEGDWYFYGPTESVETMYENMHAFLVRNEICANIEKLK